tara:strand:- start:1648 stop:2361 length:714 start_codon:yes stop_codon:yes gene_type:complete
MLPAGIDTLKASIGRRGGLARSNRFAVYMSHPSKRTDLLNTNLSDLIGNAARQLLTGGSITLQNFVEDPRDTFLFCESVDMPGRQIATNDFSTDMKMYKKPYAYMNDDVAMTFLVTNDYYMYKYVKSWMDVVMPVINGSYKVGYKSDYARDITIQQLGSNNYVPAAGIVLKNAYPTTMSAITLSSTSENEIVRLTVNFAYDDWEEQSAVEGIGTGIKEVLGSISNSIDTVRNIGKLL